MSISDSAGATVSQDDDETVVVGDASNEEVSPTTSQPLEGSNLIGDETPLSESTSTVTGLNDDVESHLSVSDQQKAADPSADLLMIFGVTAKAAAEVILQYLADERSVDKKKEWNPRVMQALEEVVDVLEPIKGDPSASEQIATYMATEENALYAFYALLTIFPAFFTGGGIDRLLADSLLMVHRMIVEWTHSGKVFPTAVVQRGLMVQHIDELSMLQQAWKSIQIANTFAELNLTILYNCTCATSIKDYFVHPSYDCAQILMPFTQSSDASIRIHAVFVLCHLSMLLTSQQTDLLHLRSEDMGSMLGAFEYASTAGDHKACLPNSTRVMTVSEMTEVLVNLQMDKKNRTVILERNIIPTLTSLLAAERAKERTSGCRLLWSLLHDSAFREQVHSSDLPIAEMLQALRDDPDKDVRQVALCTLFCLEGMGQEGTSSCLEFARGCYQYGYYSKCSELCEQISKDPTIPQSEMNQAMLLLGKANFHLYRKMQFEIQKEKRLQQYYTPSYQAKHKQCYEKAKIVIGKLGAAMDGNFLEMEEEEMKMLDIAMIDHLQETNKLERCLLCLKHTKLMKSHYFPKSLLKDFCSGLESADDQKVLIPRHAYETYQGTSKSPTQMVYFMFCHDCEQFLSKHGETQFRPEFFCRIYDPNNPFQRKAKQSIEYGDWLYEFCLGIILRGLAVFRKDCLFNSEQIHQLFQKCRHFLLNPDSRGLDSPTVALFISPPEATPEISGGALNLGSVQAFVQYWHLCIRLDGLRQHGPPQLHSFVVHFAEINIVAVLNEKDVQDIPKECLIMRGGGTYVVPDDESRWQKTPKGIIKGLQRVAKEVDEVYLGLGAKFQEQYEKKKERFHDVPGRVKETFLISTQGKSEEAAHECQQLPRPFSRPVYVNLLPEPFMVRPSHDRSSVHLPNRHHILLHVNLESSDCSGDTIFLCIGNGDPYTLDKPYVIHHHYEPNIQTHMGYFVSPTDLSAQDFLPDKWPKQALQENLKSKFITNSRSECPDILQKILGAKGFINFASLLKHFQAQSEVNYDLKCPAQQHCWYCENLCEVCMKPASFGFASEDSTGNVLRFCSKPCQAFERESPIKEPAFATEVWTPPTAPVQRFRTFPVSKTHRTLLCINALGMSAKGKYTQINLAICTGDGESGYPADKPYVAFATSDLHHQMFIEFFVSDDGQPETPLPYAANETAINVVEMLRKTKQVEYFISLALSSKGIPNLRPLLHTNWLRFSNWMI